MAGFMAGFGTTLAQLIEEDRKYYRDAAAKRRDYIQTYGTRAVNERENKANAAKGVFNYLISNDISEEDARYVLNTSGVQGLAQLKATIDSRTDLTADERSKLVKKAKDYVDENPDEDINSVLKRAYGLYKSTDNPVKRERSMFASMLGLDSRMMEDEVLDDLYINGYTGRDIYRIMGSAEAQTGTALDLDLPSKPPSPTVLNNTAKFLESQFDTSIDSRISSIEQQMLKADPDSTDYKDLNDEVTKLENLKAKGLLALGEYAAAYDPALFDFARAQEEALPGSITRNSYLFEFLPAYQTHFEEAKDEDKLAAAAETTETSVTTPKAPEVTTDIKQPPKGDGVKKFATADEFNKAVEAGEVVNGDRVKVGDGDVSTFDAPETEKGTTDLGDMTGAPGFRETDDIPEETVNLITSVFADPSKELQETDYATWGNFVDFLKMRWDEATADRGYSIAGYTEEDFNENPDKVLKEVGITEKNYPDVIQRIASQKRQQDAEMEERIKDDARQFIQDEKSYPQPLNRIVIDTKQDVETMEDRIREDARQFLQDEKSFPQPLPKIVIDTVVESVAELPYKLVAEAVRKDEDRTYGARGKPVIGPDLEKAPETVTELGPEAVNAWRKLSTAITTDSSNIETPSSMAVETMTTRGKKARPSGLMSPPSSGTAPKLGQAEFGDLIDRVHGSSKAAEAFSNKVSSGKVTAADVTRLIKATRKLPKTTSRGTLLDSLFDLRDALNNR